MWLHSQWTYFELRQKIFITAMKLPRLGYALGRQTGKVSLSREKPKSFTSHREKRVNGKWLNFWLRSQNDYSTTTSLHSSELWIVCSRAFNWSKIINRASDDCTKICIETRFQWHMKHLIVRFSSWILCYFGIDDTTHSSRWDERRLGVRLCWGDEAARTLTRRCRRAETERFP